MKLVVDANILFASLIKESLTAELLLSDKLNLFAPEFIFDEFIKYEANILEKTNRSKEDFAQYLNILKEEIEIIPQNMITPFIEKVENVPKFDQQLNKNILTRTTRLTEKAILKLLR